MVDPSFAILSNQCPTENRREVMRKGDSVELRPYGVRSCRCIRDWFGRRRSWKRPHGLTSPTQNLPSYRTGCRCTRRGSRRHPAHRNRTGGRQRSGEIRLYRHRWQDSSALNPDRCLTALTIAQSFRPSPRLLSQSGSIRLGMRTKLREASLAKTSIGPGVRFMPYSRSERHYDDHRIEVLRVRENGDLSTTRCTSCTSDKYLQTINVSGPNMSGYLGRLIQEPSLVLEWKRRPKPNSSS